MPATSAAEAALINDVQFQHELARLEEADERSLAKNPSADGIDDALFDAFDALDEGLGVRPTQPPPRHHDAVGDSARGDGRQPFVLSPAPLEPRVSAFVAALVLLVCLIAGATAAVLAQPDPEAAISDLTASR